MINVDVKFNDNKCVLVIDRGLNASIEIDIPNVQAIELAERIIEHYDHETRKAIYNGLLEGTYTEDELNYKEDKI